MESLVKLETFDSIAVVTLDNPPVNALSQAVREQLLACIQRAQADPAARAIVLRCEGSTFVAGADIKEFDLPLSPPHLPDVLLAIENSEKPVIAALQGSVLGGGLELALACHVRIAHSAAVFGLPEVSLGLIPGAGGTQRLARLCGMEVTVDLVIAGKRLSAEQARSVGLVDDVVATPADAAAIEQARRRVANDLPWTRTRDRDVPAFDAGLLEQHVAALLKKRPGEQAPRAAMQAIEAAVSRPFDEAMQLERSLFVERRQSEQARALRHLFFAERALSSRTRKLARSHVTPAIDQVAVIGSGTMGTGIAICMANAGLRVALIDVQEAALHRGMQTIDRYYEDALRKGRISSEQASQGRALIQAHATFDAVAEVDLVVEAVFEDMDVKREVFRQLDARCRADAILATNTSYLDVEVIANGTQRPQRVLGMHFFSPAPIMKLLEVVQTPTTQPAVLAAVLQLGERLGKVAVTVGVCDGFVGNRLLAAREREAMFLLEEGARPEDVDRVMRAWGLPMGPFELRDLAGVDVAWRNRQGRLARLSDRERRCSWVDDLYAAGRLGQKSGAGYYRYEEGSRTARPDPWLNDLLEAHRQREGLVPRHIEDREIEERCLFAMINEAAWLVDNDIVAHPSDIDLVWIHGYGFPRYRGGLTYYADQLGLGHIAAALQRHDAQGAEALTQYLSQRSSFHSPA